MLFCKLENGFCLGISGGLVMACHLSALPPPRKCSTELLKSPVLRKKTQATGVAAFFALFYKYFWVEETKFFL